MTTNLRKNLIATLILPLFIGLTIVTIAKIAFAVDGTNDISNPVSDPISGPVTPSPSAIMSPSPSATPSAIPSATPSATPSASPTASPSASPSPSASASPSATPVVSPNPTASPNILGDSASGAYILRQNHQLRLASFQVREADSFFPVGGSVSSSAAGANFTAKIQCVNIVDNTAWFSGPITASIQPSYYGKWVFQKVEDISVFGFGGKVSSDLVSPDPTCSLTNSQSTPVDGPFNVFWGIINVQGS